MKWLGSARQRWWLLAVAWLTLLVLGIGGFIQQSEELGNSTSFLDNLYFTLQLAALDFGGDSDAMNWRLQVARFVAPIIAAGTLLQSASVVFREQFAGSGLAGRGATPSSADSVRSGTLLASALVARSAGRRRDRAGLRRRQASPPPPTSGCPSSSVTPPTRRCSAPARAERASQDRRGGRR